MTTHEDHVQRLLDQREEQGLPRTWAGYSAEDLPVPTAEAIAIVRAVLRDVARRRT